jgi:hypothetical protein
MLQDPAWSRLPLVDWVRIMLVLPPCVMPESGSETEWLIVFVVPSAAVSVPASVPWATRRWFSTATLWIVKVPLNVPGPVNPEALF